MDLWREDAAQWWAAASQEQKQAVMAVIREWGRAESENPDLAPGDYRIAHGCLAGQLAWLTRLDPDPELLRRWNQQPPVIRAEWVQAVSQVFEPSSLGAEVAQDVRLALAPPPFCQMQDRVQVNLLGQITGEIAAKLAADPAWYGKELSRHYQSLSDSLADLMHRVGWPKPDPIEIKWSHMEPKVREGLLGEIGEFASKTSRSRLLTPEASQILADLGRAVQQILAPERER